LRLGSKAAAFHWGFAEATVFFIVPDALLTSLALNSLRTAVTAALLAALGATVGGLAVWFLASSNPETANNILLAVPGISESTFQTVRKLFSEGTYTGLLHGAFTGVPYKIFAAEAGFNGINPALFAALTPLARLPRFLLLSLAAWAAGQWIGARLSQRQKFAVTLSLWLVFYIVYFTLVGW
jgi:membrane protein YqaA with SNARE-associated domain